MEKILREVLRDDKSLLGRREDLIAALEKKVPANMRRDFELIKYAIELNVGEIFLVGNDETSLTYDGQYCFVSLSVSTLVTVDECHVEHDVQLWGFCDGIANHERYLIRNR